MTPVSRRTERKHRSAQTEIRCSYAIGERARAHACARKAAPATASRFSIIAIIDESAASPRSSRRGHGENIRDIVSRPSGGSSRSVSARALVRNSRNGGGEREEAGRGREGAVRARAISLDLAIVEKRAIVQSRVLPMASPPRGRGSQTRCQQSRCKLPAGNWQSERR